MSYNICCVRHCFAKFGGDLSLHTFPNPINDVERFRIWVSSIGGELANLEGNFVFKNRRVCNKHFEKIYRSGKTRLTRIAVPTLDIPGELLEPTELPNSVNSETCAKHNDHSYCKENGDTKIPDDINLEDDDNIEDNAVIDDDECDDIVYSDVESDLEVEETVIIEDIEDTIGCRICLVTNTKLFHITFSRLNKFYNEILMPAKPSNEYLPNYVCYECAALLHKWHQFRKQCRFTAKALKKMHETDKMVSMDSLKKFNRKKYKLDSKLDFMINNMKNIKEIQVVSNREELTMTDNEEACDDNQLIKVVDYNDDDDNSNEDNNNENNNNNEEIGIPNTEEDIENIDVSNDFTWPMDEETDFKDNEKVDDTSKLLESGHWTIETLSEKEALALSISIREKNTVCSKLYTDKEKHYADFKSHEENHLDEQFAYLNEKIAKQNGKCKICYKSLLYICETAHFEKMHSIKYQCTRCTYVCIDAANMRRHNKTHNQNEYFLCDYCGLYLKLKARSRHIYSHQPKSCVYCGVDIKNHCLKSHIKANHSDEEREYQECLDNNTGVSCQSCDVTFISPAAYNRHFIESARHSIENGTWNKKKNYCMECDAFFHDSPALNKHRRRMHSLENHVCSVCCEQVSGRELKVPLGQHANRPRLSCSICGMKFCFRSLLMKHSKIHGILNMKPFKCEHCVCAFKSKLFLKRHYKVYHCGDQVDRPYKCPQCTNLTFKNIKVKQQHVRMYHAEIRNKQNAAQANPSRKRILRPVDDHLEITKNEKTCRSRKTKLCPTDDLGHETMKNKEVGYKSMNDEKICRTIISNLGSVDNSSIPNPIDNENIQLRDSKYVAVTDSDNNIRYLVLDNVYIEDKGYLFYETGENYDVQENLEIQTE